jgi:hypothetical protein
MAVDRVFLAYMGPRVHRAAAAMFAFSEGFIFEIRAFKRGEDDGVWLPAHYMCETGGELGPLLASLLNVAVPVHCVEYEDR